jgi:uncharacterized protein (DUF2147 family)
MKRKITLVLAIIFAFSGIGFKSLAQADKIVGLWKTIDDDTKKEKSYVRIYKANDGKYYGKVEKLLNDPQDKKCDKCPDNLKNKPIVGMVILKEMEADDDGLDDGQILDPGNGSWYYCTMELDEDNIDKLEVRGSLDAWSIIGRTQYWYRVK